MPDRTKQHVSQYDWRIWLHGACWCAPLPKSNIPKIHNQASSIDALISGTTEATTLKLGTTKADASVGQWVRRRLLAAPATNQAQSGAALVGVHLGGRRGRRC